MAWGRACIADLDDTEGSVIRQILENLGLAVEMYGIGQARHLAALLHGDGIGGVPDFLIITGHGEGGSIVVPECTDELERLQPFHRALTPAEVRAHFALSDTTVLSLACTTGSDALADAFLSAGARAYLGPSGYPEGTDAMVFVHLVFYGLTQGHDLDTATQRARDFASPLQEWRLWTR